MRIERKRLADLLPADYNPRTITQREFDGLKTSLSKWGCVEPIVWNERSGNIVGGHQRCKGLLELGVEDSLVVVVDLPSDEEKALNLQLNNWAAQGDWSDFVEDLLDSMEEPMGELYNSLRFDDLRQSLGCAPSAPEGPHNSEVDLDALLADLDGCCPCCGFRWQVDAEDIVLVEPEQMERAVDED